MKNISITDDERERLAAAFNTGVSLPADVFAEMQAHWQVITLKRKQPVTIYGDTERYLYFVTKGIQRCYSVHKDKEATIIFTYPYSFTGVIDSFLLQQPSAYDLETLTDSRLLRIAYADFMLIVNKHPVMEKWLRVTLSLVVAGLLARQKELSVYPAADKLNALFKRSPHLFNLVPHKYIASYVGVDPATFSKMLARLAPEK